jgi:hypothetical protein
MSTFDYQGQRAWDTDPPERKEANGVRRGDEACLGSGFRSIALQGLGLVLQTFRTLMLRQNYGTCQDRRELVRKRRHST